jgi:MoxR-like ATPase
MSTYAWRDQEWSRVIEGKPPLSPALSPELWDRWSQAQQKALGGRARYGTLQTWAMFQVGGAQVKLDSLPAPRPARSFPLPEGYHLPQRGAAGRAALRAWKALQAGRSIYLYGDAGTGKSALIRALCALSRREASHYAMRESLDPEAYLGRTVVAREEGVSVTRFEKGPLLLDLEGRVGADGVRRPVVILLDDMDRAPAEYVEILRHVLEDNARNVFVPELGAAVDVFPGTVIVATANSAGRGDPTALYSSVQVLDDSVLDRFQAFVKAHWLDSSEELEVLQAMYPRFPEAALTRVLDVAVGMREAAKRGNIQGSFSMRRLKLWLSAAAEIWEQDDGMALGRETPALLRAAEDWLDRLDDDMARPLAEGLLQTTFAQGAAAPAQATPSRRKKP